MKAMDTKYAKKYASYHSKGIFINWNNNWEILTNESAIELNNLIADFLEKNARWKSK